MTLSYWLNIWLFFLKKDGFNVAERREVRLALEHIFPSNIFRDEFKEVCSKRCVEHLGRV